MKKNPKIYNSISRETAIAGWVYYAFELLFLPSILLSIAEVLGMNDAEMNFAYYLLNFVCVFAIFRGFLARSLEHSGKHMAAFLRGVVLGVPACWACNLVFGLLTERFAPGYANANDTAVIAMVAQAPVLMGIGTIFLVPTAEECLFRGLVFSQLKPKNRAFAYAFSAAAFCCIHVVGFVGAYPAATLALCFEQYIPSGLILAWAYDHSGTIIAPILIHTAINAIAFFNVV